MRHEQQALLIDADDTLWETNVRYEKVLETYTRLLEPLGCAPASLLAEVADTERRQIPTRGYGARHFLVTLEEIYRRHAGPRAEVAVVDEIRGFRHPLLEEPLRLFPGVRETLDHLAQRHRLVLFTRGDAEEQQAKIASSGLESYFIACEIVAEKNEAAYRALLGRHGFPARTAWMVGNSPRADINPALAAGLNAVYIPSAHPWDYETEELRAVPGKLLVLESFRQMQEHF